ncbi:hypothetical protein BGZ83_004228, partial [Gryganskiella cystojenkinii]
WSATDKQQGRGRGRSRRPRQGPEQIYEKRFEYKFCLNPGPFSIKEHALIISMVRCSVTFSFDNAGTQILFLEESIFSVRRSIWAALGLCITSQMAGFALAGGLRRILIQPPQMVWPETLALAALIRSLHSQKSVELLEAEKEDRAKQQLQQGEGQQLGQEGQQQRPHHTEPQNRMSRMRYFWWICMGSFVYNFLPVYIFPTLGTLSILCWIAPNNLVLSQLTGSQGLGIGTVTLDWSLISNLMPLLTPWWVQANMMAGMFLIVYLMTTWGYYTDVFGTMSYPLASYIAMYGENGTRYNIGRVMYYQNFTLNEQAYEQYGPVRLPFYAITMYFCSFAVLSATISHAVMYHGSDMRRLFKTGLLGREDVHTRMMRAYPEVPDLWYQILMGIMFIITLVTCQVYDYMPWWASLLAFVLTTVLILPVGIVTALTNQTPFLSTLASYVIGYLQPGHFMTAAVFRSYGANLASQAVIFLSGLKLGHYLKVPPRIMFWTQIVGGLLGAVVNVATYRWILAVYPDICFDDANLFSCPGFAGLQNSAFIWGAIGPKRIFGGWDVGGYGFIQLGFLAGAALPVLTWYLNKKILPARYGSYLDLVHWPVIMSPGVMMLTVSRPYMIATSLFIGFIFMFVLRRYRFEWWSSHSDSIEGEEFVLPPEDIELGNNIPLVDIKSYFNSHLVPPDPQSSQSPLPNNPESNLNEQNAELKPLDAAPEARSNVSNRDDPTMPCNTFRMWFLGLFFSATVTFLNQLYSFRDGRMTIAYPVVALLCLPLGHLLARILPRRTFRIWIGGWKKKKRPTAQQQQQQYQRSSARARRQRQRPEQIYEKRLEFKFCLNPGPFSVKEHALIVSMVQCASARNLGIMMILNTEDVVFSAKKPIWAGLGLCITLQMAGYGIAGGLRRILVQPAQMIWPQTLAVAALIRSLHSQRSVELLEAEEEAPDGHRYNVSQVMNPKDWTLNEAAYQAEGPVMMPFSMIMTYFLNFAMIAATISHTIVYHGTDVLPICKTGLLGREDIHTRMMRAYPEVPDLWYQMLLGIMTLLTLITCEVYDYMPWWVTLVVFLLIIILILPMGIITALTNQTPVLSLLASYLIGYLRPGHLMTSAVFRSYGANLATQTLIFLSGLKLGHYLKVPPRVMFWTQIVGGLVGAIVNLLTYRWILAVTPNLCAVSPGACSAALSSAYTAFLWGAMGPTRLFRNGIFGDQGNGRYGLIEYGFLVGAALPFVTWYLGTKVLPGRFGSLLNRIHWPIMLTPGVMNVLGYPYTLANSIFVGFIFMFVLRRYRFEWWSRYTFITSVAMDTGVAISTVFIFFVFQMNNIKFPICMFDD